MPILNTPSLRLSGCESPVSISPRLPNPNWKVSAILKSSIERRRMAGFLCRPIAGRCSLISAHAWRLENRVPACSWSLRVLRSDRWLTRLYLPGQLQSYRNGETRFTTFPPWRDTCSTVEESLEWEIGWNWSGRVDSNHRPPGPEPGALARLSHAPTGLNCS